MKKLLLTALTATVLTAGAMSATAQDEVTYDHTANVINNAGVEIGTIGLTQGPAGVLLNVDLSDLPAGKHGFHLHHTGDCSDHEAFKASGGHIAMEGAVHGLLNPEGPEAGDLPNLIVDESGAVEAELYVSGMTINDGGTYTLSDDNGSAFVIHEGPDDHMTQPIGGAGARIACGVVEGAAAAMDADKDIEAEAEAEAEAGIDTDISGEE